jgi:hypothetical protein
MIAPTPLFLSAGTAVRFLALSWLAAFFSFIAGRHVDREPGLGIVLLWTGVGIALALGLAGIFSVGLIYIITAVLMLLAIRAAPNPTGPSYFGLKYILPEVVSFCGSLWLILL